MWSTQDIDVTRPNPARMYDYFLGGTHNFAADREMATQVLASWPETTRVARANRAFLRRAVRYLSTAGIRQFLDIGSGIPTAGNVHELVPDARVVYVDLDPIAVAHSRALLADHPLAAMVHADLCDPERILDDEAVGRLLDFTEPVALLVVSVLHFVADERGPDEAVRRLGTHLAPGSFLTLSHASGASADADTGRAEEIAELYRRRTRTPGVLRSRAEIMDFFDGYDLVEPGLVNLPDWRPEEADPGEEYHEAIVYAGVGRRR
jgi:SAM-dependent methyltransferase